MQNKANVIFSCLVSILFVACSSKKADEPKELQDPSVKEALEISLDTPETTLLANGKKYFNTGLYSLAQQNFEALRTGYPMSQYVEFAEIKIADCLFEGSEYVEASKAYEDFTKARPASEAYPYMLFRAARSHQLSHKGVGRDTAPLERALELYNRFLSEHPDSAYTASAKQYRSEVVKALAEHEERIINFYKKQNRDAAVTARQKTYAEKWVPVIQQTAYTPEVIAPAPEEALPPPATSSMGRAMQGSQGAPMGRILKIECTAAGTRGIFIHFDRDMPLLARYKSSQSIPSQNGTLSVSLTGVSAPQQTSNCFAEGDLSLTQAGELLVRSNVSGSAVALNNPPRLFISVPAE